MNTRSSKSSPARVERVEGSDEPLTLVITWHGGEVTKINFTALVDRIQAFKIFRDKPQTFASVNPMAWGDGIQWSNGLEYGAAALRRLADEQKTK